MINTVLHTCVRLKVKTNQPLWSSSVLESCGTPPVLLTASLFPAVTRAQRAEAASWPSTIPFPAGFQTFHVETPAPEETNSPRPSRLFFPGSRHRACLHSSPQNNTVVRSSGSCQSSRQPLFFIYPQNRQFLSCFPAVQFSSDSPRRK